MSNQATLVVVMFQNSISVESVQSSP